MARVENRQIVGIKTQTLGFFYGTFWAIVGLAIAIIHSLRATVDVASETESVFSGLAFGLATGIVSILVVPLIYFGIGWLVGVVHGFIFNVVAESSGGLTLRMQDSEDQD